MTMKYNQTIYGCVAGLMILSFYLTLSSGCSPGGYSGPTGTVTGTITRGEKPLPPGCRVSFVSAEGFTASGQVDRGGKYTLMNLDKPQIPAASYKVCLTPPPQPERSEEEYEKAMAAGTTGTSETPSDVIPNKYQNPTTTDLSYEVKPGPNTFDIELP